MRNQERFLSWQRLWERVRFLSFFSSFFFFFLSFFVLSFILSFSLLHSLFYVLCSVFFFFFFFFLFFYFIIFFSSSFFSTFFPNWADFLPFPAAPSALTEFVPVVIEKPVKDRITEEVIVVHKSTPPAIHDVKNYPHLVRKSSLSLILSTFFERPL